MLETELASVGRHNPDIPYDWDPSLHENTTENAEIESRASEISEFENRNAIEEPLESRYRMIIDSLDATSGKNYGTCSICGKEIEFERLMANPTAKTCKTHLNT